MIKKCKEIHYKIRETSVASQDCNHGVCPQTERANFCIITDNVATWYSPPSDSSPITTISSLQQVVMLIILGLLLLL